MPNDEGFHPFAGGPWFAAGQVEARVPMNFLTRLVWTGAADGPARDSRTFSRDLEVSVTEVSLPVSAAPAYHGDPARANPEQLFVAAISACQALT